MSVQIVNPLVDSRWDVLVSRHAKASIFHERGWLQALNDTYGYEPLLLTSAEIDEPLREGIVLCRVSSWITGTRLVSLPFADHCEPLVDAIDNAHEFLDWLQKECDSHHWKYVELRPLSLSNGLGQAWSFDRTYQFHRLDLSPTLEQIFKGFHRDSMQRRIRRAESEGLSYEAGQSQSLLDSFYGLLLKTRRRHGLIPQPRAWFRNLVRCLGDKLSIRLARKNATPVAALLTLRHEASVVYKYGCSDEKFHHLAGMPFLFWKLIEESKSAGAEEIDFGRSDLDNQGLTTFKDRFGTTRRPLTYLRYTRPQKGHVTMSWGLRPMQHVLSALPDALLPTASSVLYRHMG